MKTLLVVVGFFSAFAICHPGAARSQELLGSSVVADPGAGMPTNSPAGRSTFADGIRAINDGRWNDADVIFTNLSARDASNADGEWQGDISHYRTSQHCATSL